MSDRTCSPADLELFVDLDTAARTARIEPCLIGAGAIQMGPELSWVVRLSRRTRDWDFAARVASWKEFDELAALLTAPRAGFTREREPHRFRHRSGGTLDLVPYGALENPAGRIRWSDETTMETLGLEALDQNHSRIHLGPVELRIASLPALVGLKLLAYRFRRPGITRDIADVHSILRQVDAQDARSGIDERAFQRLGDEAIHFNALGSYLLGREVGRAFAPDALEAMLTVLAAAAAPEGGLVRDVQRGEGESGTARENIVSRFTALRVGMGDR
jgi:predicted nucleotidyltransferase